MVKTLPASKHMEEMRRCQHCLCKFISSLFFCFFIPKIASVESGIRSATARTFFFLSWLMLKCVRGRYKSQVLREANGTQRAIWCVCRKWIMSFVSLMTRGPRSHFIPPPCGKLRLITTLSSDVAP